METAISVIIGAFLQELIIPFPSFLIFVPGGAALKTQNVDLSGVIVLALLVGFARVLAGLILYRLSAWAQHRLYTKNHSWLGIRRSHLDHARRALGKSGSWWAVFSLWALPIVPSMVISLSAGFIKVRLPVFITATYAGAVVNALSFLLIGYFGLQALVGL